MPNTASMTATSPEGFPAGYRPDNVLGALVEAVVERHTPGRVTAQQVAHAVADFIGDGDFGDAEDLLWDHLGRVVDLIDDALTQSLRTHPDPS